MDKVIESIEEDIEKHRADASNMLNFVGTAAFVVILALFVTVAPEIADRFIPSLENSVVKHTKLIEDKKAEFKSKFSKEFYYLSEDDYEELEDEGLVNEIDKAARRISKLSKGPTLRLEIAKIVSKMNIASEKSDLIFKAVPILFIAIFVGSLFTYRFHMQIVRDLSMKRIELLIIKAENEKAANQIANSEN